MSCSLLSIKSGFYCANILLNIKFIKLIFFLISEAGNISKTPFLFNLFIYVYAYFFMHDRLKYQVSGCCPLIIITLFIANETNLIAIKAYLKSYLISWYHILWRVLHRGYSLFFLLIEHWSSYHNLRNCFLKIFYFFKKVYIAVQR